MFEMCPAFKGVTVERKDLSQTSSLQEWGTTMACKHVASLPTAVPQNTLQHNRPLPSHKGKSLLAVSRNTALMEDF